MANIFEGNVEPDVLRLAAEQLQSALTVYEESERDASGLLPAGVHDDLVGRAWKALAVVDEPSGAPEIRVLLDRTDQALGNCAISDMY